MCAVPGEGMVNLGVRVVADFRYLKCSTMIGREQATLPATLAIGGTSSALNVMPATGTSVMPSSCCKKSRCQKSRRNSPSVTDCSPSFSCRRTAAAMARSSTARSSSAESAPDFALARASRSSGGRSRLPTWSAWKGGLAMENLLGEQSSSRASRRRRARSSRGSPRRNRRRPRRNVGCRCGRARCAAR